MNRRLIHDISRRDINSILTAIVKRGSPSSANHALAAVRKFFNWAVDECHLNGSPCIGIRAPSKTKSRERVLTTSELSKIWSAAEQMGFPYGKIIQLLILTGQRRNEVAGMRWIEVDLAQGLWAISAERTKANRAHDLPLSEAALGIRSQIPRVHDDLVFPALGRNISVSGFSKWKAHLDELAGVDGWRVHDVRRTVARWMARL